MREKQCLGKQQVEVLLHVQKAITRSVGVPRHMQNGITGLAGSRSRVPTNASAKSTMGAVRSRIPEPCTFGVCRLHGTTFGLIVEGTFSKCRDLVGYDKSTASIDNASASCPSFPFIQLQLCHRAWIMVGSNMESISIQRIDPSGDLAYCNSTAATRSLQPGNISPSCDTGRQLYGYLNWKSVRGQTCSLSP